MKMIVRSFFYVAMVTLYHFAGAQSISAHTFPQKYFRNPLDIPVQLVSNFGELRPNHFHMGLDIRTQGRENLPVYAAAPGYVSRIKMEKYGYGNAIYISHPNGYTTLYAHLNTFYPALNEYIKAKQYKEQSWKQDFELPAGLFPVTKGQFIAYSGNTGSSAGPHLHFEMRDTKTGDNVNPLLFGFDIPDTRPPVIYGLYWYDRRYSTYQVPGKQIPLTHQKGIHKATANVVRVNSPLITLGIRAEDITSSSPFRLGIYAAELYMDGSLISAFRLDSISYDETRYVNACIDYSKYAREKVYVQYFGKLPGNKLNIFTPTNSSGVIILTDTAKHTIEIVVKDCYGHSTSLNFILQLTGELPGYPYPPNARPLIPERENIVTGEHVKLEFSRNAFYDGVPFVLSESVNAMPNSASAYFSLHNPNVPVHDFYNIQIKTALASNDPLRDRIVMQLVSGTNKQIVKGRWEGDWMIARFNRLGNAQLIIDTVPPTIIPAGWKDSANLSTAQALILRCKDDLDEIDSFRAELNGQWLLFAAKGDNFIYRFDEYCPRGTYNLTVTVTDIAGNTTRETYTFTR